MQWQSIKCTKLYLTELLTRFFNFMQKIVIKNCVSRLRKPIKHFKCGKSKKNFFLHWVHKIGYKVLSNDKNFTL